jgi:hypothetical protein
MKELLTLQGGYPREMDYLLNLQSELYTVTTGLFNSLGADLVLAGCAVHNNGNGTINIAAGLVYVAGEPLRFDATLNVPADGTKTFVKGGYVSTDSKLFADGFNKNVYREAKAVIANVTGSAAEIKIKTTLYNLRQYIQDSVQSFEVKGTFKEIYDFDGTFLDNFDESGLGVTPQWIGWALDNGSNGTPGSIGKVLIAAGKYTDPVSGEETVYNNGDETGERLHKLLPAEMARINIGRTRTDNTGRPPYEPNHLQGGSGRGLYLEDNYIGNDQPHNNMQPSLAVYRVIKIV